MKQQYNFCFVLFCFWYINSIHIRTYPRSPVIDQRGKKFRSRHYRKNLLFGLSQLLLLNNYHYHYLYLLMGHFNSRTRKYSDTVSHEGNSIITNGQSDSAFQPAQRNSFDNVLNNNGKKLLEICKKLDLRIVNGR